ncbi:PepSY-associated TM helix domain-containing protein [Sphingomonas sp. HDW15A]|uniref:PepSY-associated TM helix domain-containing protein n=1 Tax=Sphingomonas sp. HDW15A TaxID=2714942 RepID=UPI001F10F048|nr:PepSY-associated TM helix domain-containing protein [Sphingomonas sp. HDW15A]
MKTLSFLHRWAGGIIGLLLALIGLSGAALVWEGEWINLPGSGDPVIERVDVLAEVSERAIAAGATRITFASEEIGLHHAAYPGGAGAYFRQDGSISVSWSSMWERPEFWLFDFHHHLFAGETGETITGIAGLAGLLFVVTGVILWWRSRRAYEFRLWPRRFQPGPIVRHHRDLGILIAPLLLISMLTGIGMLYQDAARAILGGTRTSPAPKVEEVVSTEPAAIGQMLTSAKAQFPESMIRRLTIPSKPGTAYSVRLRQPSEWTPNGRTTLYFDATGTLLRTDNPLRGPTGDLVIEKLYPVHSGKIGALPGNCWCHSPALDWGCSGFWQSIPFGFGRSRPDDGAGAPPTSLK